jgi:hypothetical protein
MNLPFGKYGKHERSARVFTMKPIINLLLHSCFIDQLTLWLAIPFCLAPVIEKQTRQNSLGLLD